jgi:hypothetical protein
MGTAGLLLVAASVIAVMWPRVVSLPLAVFGVWAAVSAFIRAFHLRREGKREGRSRNSGADTMTRTFMMRLGRQRTVQRDDVRSGEEALERDITKTQTAGTEDRYSHGTVVAPSCDEL